MGIFGNSGLDLNKAKVSGGGIYFGPGEYECRILAVKMVQTRNKGAAFCAEHEVVSSTNAEHPAGTRINFFQLLTGEQADFAPMNIKEYLMAATGVEPGSADEAKNDWDAIGESAVAEANPLSSHLIKVSGFFKPRKNKKRDLTKTESEDPNLVLRTRYSAHPSTKALMAEKKAKAAASSAKK